MTGEAAKERAPAEPIWRNEPQSETCASSRLSSTLEREGGRWCTVWTNQTYKLYLSMAVCLGFATIGCSQDRRCMSEWYADERECYHALFTCKHENQEGVGHSGCDDENLVCADEAWSSMAQCAEPEGCLDQFIYCWEYHSNWWRSDLDPGCYEGLDSCAHWYDYVCIEECRTGMSSMQFGGGWLGLRDRHDWLYDCFISCL